MAIPRGIASLLEMAGALEVVAGSTKPRRGMSASAPFDTPTGHSPPESLLVSILLAPATHRLQDVIRRRDVATVRGPR